MSRKAHAALLPSNRPQDLEKEFINTVDEFAYGSSRYQAFADFCEMAYCALRKPTLVGEKAEKIEAQYMSAVKRLKPATVQRMPHLLSLTMMAVRETGRDFLGKTASTMEIIHGDNIFFTPFDVAAMMARMIFGNEKEIQKKVKQTGFLTLAEPACGSGVMVLAAAQELERLKKFKVQEQLYVEATDIASLCFHMAYIQLAIRGVPARVIHGDTLLMKTYDSALTPAFFGFFKKNSKAFQKWWKEGIKARALPPPTEKPAAEKKKHTAQTEFEF